MLISDNDSHRLCPKASVVWLVCVCQLGVAPGKGGGGTLSVCMPQCVFQMEPGPGALKNPCLCHPISGLSQGALSPRGAATQHKAEGLWGSFFPNLSCIAPHPSQLYSGTQVFFSF